MAIRLQSRYQPAASEQPLLRNAEQPATARIASSDRQPALATRRAVAGQASVMGIALALMLIAGLYALYNIGQTTTEKTRVVNAADAAAYSSGIQVARNLNFLAYTNRAMIANHLAVGHATSYMSWVDYLGEVVRDLATWLFWVPGVGPATAAANNFLTTFEPTNELVTRAIAISSQGLNRAIFLGQLGAQDGMTPDALSTLQDEILRAHGLNIQRVGLGEAAGTAGASQAFLRARARQVAETVELLDFVNFAGAAPDEDGGMLHQMVDRSVDYVNTQRPTRWLRDDEARNWRFTIWPFRAIKDGFTRQVNVGDNMGWEAEDELRFQIWGCRRFRCRYRTRENAVGMANTGTWDSYDGIFRYTSVRNAAPTRREAHSSTVIARLNLAGASLMQAGPGAHAQETEALYAVSCAEVHFHRPDTFGAWGGGRVEYPNLFNPFWKVRLRQLNDCGADT